MNGNVTKSPCCPLACFLLCTMSFLRPRREVNWTRDSTNRKGMSQKPFCLHECGWMASLVFCERLGKMDGLSVEMEMVSTSHFLSASETKRSVDLVLVCSRDNMATAHPSEGGRGSIQNDQTTIGALPCPFVACISNLSGRFMQLLLLKAKGAKQSHSLCIRDGEKSTPKRSAHSARDNGRTAELSKVQSCLNWEK